MKDVQVSGMHCRLSARKKSQYDVALTEDSLGCCRISRGRCEEPWSISASPEERCGKTGGLLPSRRTTSPAMRGVARVSGGKKHGGSTHRDDDSLGKLSHHHYPPEIYYLRSGIMAPRSPKPFPDI